MLASSSPDQHHNSITVDVICDAGPAFDTDTPTPRAADNLTVESDGLLDGLASVKSKYPQIVNTKAKTPTSVRQRQSRFGPYGFPAEDKRSPAKNPVSAVVELKLLSGVISQEEAEAILKIVHPATDTAHASGSGVSEATLESERHLQEWERLMGSLQHRPPSVRPSPMPSPLCPEFDATQLRPSLRDKLQNSPGRKERRQFLSPSMRLQPSPATSDRSSPLKKASPSQHVGKLKRSASMDIPTSTSTLGRIQERHTLTSPDRRFVSPTRRVFTSPERRHTFASPARDLEIPDVPSIDVFPRHFVAGSVDENIMDPSPNTWTEDDGLRQRSLSDPCLVRSREQNAGSAVTLASTRGRGRRSRKSFPFRDPANEVKGLRRTRSLPAGTLQFRLLALNLTPLRAPQATDFSQRPSTSTSGLSSDDEKTLPTPPLTASHPTVTTESVPTPIVEHSPWDIVSHCELPLGPPLQDLIQRGVPPQYRSFVWHALIDGYIGRERVSRGSGYYRALSNVHAETNRKAQKQIEMDLPRTFPENRFFRKGKSVAITRLRRVLTAFTRRNESIGYCQGFNFIAGFALLVLPEESAFWCLVAFVEHIMPSHYFSGELSSARDDQVILRRIVEKRHPEIHAQLQKYEFDISIVTFSWFMTLFVDDIPHEATLQIWDNLLLRGSIVLFENASAFLSICKEQILAANSRLELFSYMLSLSSQVDDYTQLAKAATSDPTISWVYINSERAKLRDAAFMKKTKEMSGRSKSPTRKRLDFEKSSEWWEPLCCSAEVRLLFAETTALCRRMAGSRGITYMRLKRELQKSFLAEVIERNQHVLQKILQVHESRMEAIAAREQGSADFKFDDVVLYPALSSINKLESVPQQFAILEQQATLCLKAVEDSGSAHVFPPPSPLLLPVSIQVSSKDPDASESSVVSSGPASEQVLRNRTAELCTQNRGSKLHYMTVKRRLTSEFGVEAYDKYKRAVQSVFRQHESQGEGLLVKGSRSRTGEVQRRLQFPTKSDELGASPGCLLYAPASGEEAGMIWSGMSDGSFVVFSPTNESGGRLICVLGEQSSGSVKCDPRSETIDQVTPKTQHKAASVTCMNTSSDGNAWVGRDDGSVVVFSPKIGTNERLKGENDTVETVTINEYEVLQCCENESTGNVTQICTTADSAWCAVSTGLLVQFDAQNLQRTRIVKLQIPLGSFYAPQNKLSTGVSGVHELDQEPGITDLLNGSTAMPERRFAPATMLIVGDMLWVGTGRHLIVHNVTDTERKDDCQQREDEVDGCPSPQRYGVKKGKLSMNGKRRFVVECNSTLCLVFAKGGEVWSCASHDPYMVVWDASREDHPLKKAEFAVPWGERGIAQLISQSGFVWAACRDGSVIVWDASSKNPIMNVRDSAIPIKLLCPRTSRSGAEVIGMAKGATYTIVVWNA